MCANREGFGEMARMCRLACAFAGRLCDKYHNLMSWLLMIIMPPTSKKLWEHIGFRLCVRPSVCPSIRTSIRSLKTVHARVLKFHIWIPHGKIVDTGFLSCPSYLPFWSYVPLKKIRTKSNACHILWAMHTRVLKFIWIPHGKNSWPVFFSCLSSLPFWSYAPLKKSERNLVSKISRKVFELGTWNLVSL